MLVLQSEVLNVYMFKDLDYQGKPTYTVKYGLQEKSFSHFSNVMEEYYHCCKHSARCEELI